MSHIFKKNMWTLTKIIELADVGENKLQNVIN